MAKKHKLYTYVDAAGNVVIKKPTTKGFEKHPMVILQSHLDMLYQKNADTEFDFTSKGICMYLDQDWVKARDTTLDSNNDIGLVAILTLLDSDKLPHPSL